MTESFNNMLGDHRARTYLQLLEYIRRMIMRRFQQRMEDCVKWKSDLPPTVHSKILKAMQEMRKYELLGETRAYVAKLNSKTCEYGAWQINGVPCSHVMAGISHISGVNGIRDKVVEFVDPSLSKTAFIKTYGSIIHPITDQCVWPEVDAVPLIPSPLKRRPGRPKLQRKREQNEKPKEARSGSVICKICKKAGHNKRTCSGGAKRSGKKVRSTSDNVSSSQLRSHLHVSPYHAHLVMLSFVLCCYLLRSINFWAYEHATVIQTHVCFYFVFVLLVDATTLNFLLWMFFIT
ncbi:hypothetical protein ACOSQ3_021050 [Xanthoceras sorbifolium]